MNSLNRDGEEEQLRIVSKCPPELLEIVGKHSTLWNYGKLETVEKLADLIEKAKAEERNRCLEEEKKRNKKLTKEIIKEVRDIHNSKPAWKTYQENAELRANPPYLNRK